MQVSIIRAIDRALKTFAIEVTTRLTPITSIVFANYVDYK